MGGGQTCRLSRQLIHSVLWRGGFGEKGRSILTYFMNDIAIALINGAFNVSVLPVLVETIIYTFLRVL